MVSKENIALGIFIFSVLIAVVLLPFAFNGSFTGKVIQEEEQGTVQEIVKLSCTDSDGKNYGVKGAISYCDSNGCSSKEDSCSGKKVIELYCEGNEKKSEEYECGYDCDDGVCLSVSKEYTRPYIGGGSGGGGSGGSSSSVVSSPVAESGQTHDLGELDSEKVLDVLKNDNINFKILGVSYSVKIEDNTESQATITNIGTLGVGQEKTSDLNSDSVSDVYVKVRSINVITKVVILSLNKAS